jgi:hypothetical protein
MMSRRSIGILWTAAMLMCGVAAPARAQAPQDKPAGPVKLAAKVDVVISRYQGEKKISSQPYVLMPSTNQGYTNLRVGVDMPIGTTTTTTPPEGGRQGVTTTQPRYSTLGTSIDCRVVPGSDGKFDVSVNLSDSSIYNPEGEMKPPAAVQGSAVLIRNFTASNTLTMRDGQTMLLTAATDKVTGEVIKVEVTFTLIK